MESTLRRVLDYKLVFDSLCDSNGMVRVETLTARWPTNEQSPNSDSMVHQGCVRQWRACADKNGYVDWDKFSAGLQLALSEDTPRLSRSNQTDLPQSEAERKLRALRQAKQGQTGGLGQTVSSLSKVTATDIENFLLTCNRDTLTRALTRMRKDVYKGQMSIHRLTTSIINSPIKKSHAESAEQGVNVERSNDTNASRPKSGGRSIGISDREKKELTHGLELLERTRLWYSDQLKQLAKEESHDPAQSKKVKAEELLAVLETGTSSKNEKLQHLKEINTHLESLASPTPSLTSEQQSRLQKQLDEFRRERASKHDRMKPQLSQSQPLGAPTVGEAVVEFRPEDQEIIVNSPSTPTFPVYTSEELKHSNATRPSKRSSSMMEVHRVGVTGPSSSLTAGYIQDPGSSSHHTHSRYASSQNISTNSRSDRDRARRKTPKRSNSFHASPTSSGKPSERSDITSSVTDYPVAKAHREARPQQYPLRGSASMQELQHGPSERHRGVPPKKQHPPSHQQTLPKSSSVRNVSTTGSYGNHSSAPAPGLIHQQVYSTGMSYSTQTLPSSRSKHTVGSHDPRSRGTRSHSHAQRGAKTIEQTRPGSKSTGNRDKQSTHQQAAGDTILSLV